MLKKATEDRRKPEKGGRPLLKKNGGNSEEGSGRVEDTEAAILEKE